MDAKTDIDQLEGRAKNLRSKFDHEYDTLSSLVDNLKYASDQMEYWQHRVHLLTLDQSHHAATFQKVDADITELVLELDKLSFEDAERKRRKKEIYCKLLAKPSKTNTLSREKK